MTHQTVFIYLGTRAVDLGARSEGGSARSYVGIVGREANPVFKTIRRSGQGGAGRDQQQPRSACKSQLLQMVRLLGPAHDHNVHNEDVTDVMLRECFPNMKPQT